MPFDQQIIPDFEMDRFRELATFRAVAVEGAFNAAARRLGVSAPSVTRLIGDLEARLGVPLFLRSTRALALTEAGRRLLPDAERLLDDLAAAEAAAAGTHGAIGGNLRITAPVLFGQMHLAPVIRDFLDTYKEASVTALLLDRMVNLMEEGIDVALRIAELADSSLTAIRLGSVRHVVVAAPALIARHGMPETPADLAALPTIGGALAEEAARWQFRRNGRTVTVRHAPRLTTTSLPVLVDAARAGWGVARLRSYQVDADLAAGRLVELLPGTDDRHIPVNLVHREGRAAGARTRAFLDFAVPRLRAVLPETGRPRSARGPGRQS